MWTTAYPAKNILIGIILYTDVYSTRSSNCFRWSKRSWNLSDSWLLISKELLLHMFKILLQLKYLAIGFICAQERYLLRLIYLIILRPVYLLFRGNIRIWHEVWKLYYNIMLLSDVCLGFTTLIYHIGS